MSVSEKQATQKADRTGPKANSAASVVERLFAQNVAEGQALRRQWMEDLELPVTTIDDIVNAGGTLPKGQA